MNEETKQELIRGLILLALIGAQVLAFKPAAQIQARAWLRQARGLLFPSPPPEIEPSHAEIAAMLTEAEEAKDGA